MEPAADPWNINPSELLKGSMNSDPYIGFGNTNNIYNNNNHVEASGMGFGQDDLEKLLGFGCEDVDNLLSQELKDLDIPLMPRASKVNGNGAGDGDGITGLGFSGFNEDPYSLNRHNNSHKREPSGTAIFGFHNHNKTLSISNWQKAFGDPREQQQQQQQQQQQLQQQQLQQQPQQQALGSIEETNPDGYLGQVLLKQQEELRIALERQQEVNKKLEEQLEANRVQQERLQRVLGEQDVTAHKFISSESASPQSATKTPANNGKSSTIIGDDGNIIVTSNSNNGGYKFPPPANLEPPAYGPGSHTAMNGSPPRKVSRGRTPPINDDLREDADEDVAMTNYLRPEIEQKEAVADSSHFLKKRNAQPGFTNGFSIQDQTRSPVNTRSTVHHNKKESTISTVSTIPQHLDDNENSDSDSGGLLGLGIQSMNGKRAVPRNYSLRPPPVDIMPPIPGSTDNTPIPKQPQLPQKHIFQHTPVKNQYPPVKSQHPPVQQPTQGYYSNAGISTGSGTSLGENPFRDPIATPQLKPPSDHSSRRNSGYSADHNEIIGGHKSDFNGEEQQMEDGDEPESRFIVAKTPSPVLKSQGRFEGSSPQYDTTNVSPIKITRKPSTLPRGSIDKYVKELPDKLFECQYHGCGKIFKRRYNIRSHIQTHLEDRPYMCDFEGCDKAFVRNHDLVRHKKSHAEKCYACPCGKKFNREDALIVHRSRMICSGGRRYENVVIKKSPRRRGRPKKDDYSSTHSSPVKETVERSNDGYLIYKMEEQLRNEMEEYGLLRPPPNLAVTNHALLLSPSPSSDNSDMGSPKYELKEPQKKP
ncbi:hypothetical protein ZYGR_0U00760 [Zygosaccharomyces rouxii]|uniref:ZYRO0F10428p n=2 Tax=Zygosaccharomyces rouxii TaxID=4956 RepID=C5DY57_ZYGRC|nr:uncharacterized protein ZYRO0F10428g [Zygosaccharomyces rouxii]KAH9199476.1 hypothetical protein LQ764DRAFT_130570 [Zygosaccharomyces rouxii]GAV50220.1 hypothetical protein ZYGR_0U00760 [Zygosaccharomyces rouxii]CAR28718.1 ZYRO0F10428p [Zygosaccharomyces rouxii]